MNLFSISELSQFSGIKPHTIRMWEQRYGALKPRRSEGNTRYYDDLQLRRLLNIVSLMDTNYKVSELCSMPDEKLFALLREQLSTAQTEGHDEYFISQLIAAGIKYDEEYFDTILSQCLEHYHMKDAYVKVIYPTLVRIGLMWANDSIPPAQEHFISNMIRQKLFAAINALPQATNNDDAWLLFLPEHEFHEIGLLYANYMIRLSGKKVFYLGAGVPLASLKEAIKNILPNHLLLFLVHYDAPENVQEYLNTLKKEFSGKKIHLSGNQKLIEQLETGKKINLLQSAEDLVKELNFN